MRGKDLLCPPAGMPSLSLPRSDIALTTFCSRFPVLRCFLISVGGGRSGASSGFTWASAQRRLSLSCLFRQLFGGTLARYLALFFSHHLRVSLVGMETIKHERRESQAHSDTRSAHACTASPRSMPCRAVARYFSRTLLLLRLPACGSLQGNTRFFVSFRLICRLLLRRSPPREVLRHPLDTHSLTHSLRTHSDESHTE